MTKKELKRLMNDVIDFVEVANALGFDNESIRVAVLDGRVYFENKKKEIVNNELKALFEKYTEPDEITTENYRPLPMDLDHTELSDVSLLINHNIESIPLSRYRAGDEHHNNY